MTAPHRSTGFSLIELSIVLLVMGLLAGGLLTLLPARQEASSTAAAEARLAEIRDALLGFAAAHGHLPCPARSPVDGSEDRSAGNCTGGKRNGLLPWASLGLPRSDPWGRLILYSVTPAYAASSPYFTLDTKGDIVIRSRDGSGALVELAKADHVAAAFWSVGKNGHWGWQPDVSDRNPDGPAPNDDEDTNGGSAGTALVSRAPTPTGSPAGEFDDSVAWLPRYLLFNRMIAAGRLP